jgi:hypothetical protein
MVGIIVVALITIDDSVERRLWLLTGLSWLCFCFPSSFLIAPLANSLILRLDVENGRQ